MLSKHSLPLPHVADAPAKRRGWRTRPRMCVTIVAMASTATNRQYQRSCVRINAINSCTGTVSVCLCVRARVHRSSRPPIIINEFKFMPFGIIYIILNACVRAARSGTRICESCALSLSLSLAGSFPRPQAGVIHLRWSVFFASVCAHTHARIRTHAPPPPHIHACT